MSRKTKKARGRWKYVADYELDSDGKCMYKGEYYSYDVSAKKLVGMKILYSILVLVTTAVYI